MIIKQLVLPSGGFITVNKETREILILTFFFKEPENNGKEGSILLLLFLNENLSAQAGLMVCLH